MHILKIEKLLIYEEDLKLFKAIELLCEKKVKKSYNKTEASVEDYFSYFLRYYSKREHYDFFRGIYSKKKSFTKLEREMAIKWLSADSPIILVSDEDNRTGILFDDGNIIGEVTYIETNVLSRMTDQQQEKDIKVIKESKYDRQSHNHGTPQVLRSGDVKKSDLPIPFSKALIPFECIDNIKHRLKKLDQK